MRKLKKKSFEVYKTLLLSEAMQLKPAKPRKKDCFLVLSGAK